MGAEPRRKYITMNGRVYRTSDMHELSFREVEALYKEYRVSPPTPPAPPPPTPVPPPTPPASPPPTSDPLPPHCDEEQDRQQVYDRVDRECTEFMSHAIVAYAAIQLVLRVLARLLVSA